MRIKAVPEDFVVEEILSSSLQERGPYAVFRVKKRNLTTLELQAEMARRLRLPLSAIAFPALKDKVALATQHASVRLSNRPPPQRLRGRSFEAELLGFLARPLGPQDLKENRFRVTLRDLSPEEAERVQRRFWEISRDGFPNYFDIQRFGSWSARLGFPGRLLFLQKWEEALRAYLAEPLCGDPPAVLRFKSVAREHWGDWKFLKEQAPRGNIRSVLTFLCDHPADYKRAVNLITPRILSLWLSAYQSFLWNRAASLLIGRLSEGVQPCEALSFPWGQVLIPSYPLAPRLREKLATLSLPLPSSKALGREDQSPAFCAEPLIVESLVQVLAEEGLSPRDLRTRGLERAYVTGGLRPLWVTPSEPKMGKPEPDELFPGRVKITCSFTLPRGTYATFFLRLL